MGQSVVLLERDITRFGQPHTIFDPVAVAGPTFQAALDRVRATAKDGKHLLLPATGCAPTCGPRSRSASRSP